MGDNPCATETHKTANEFPDRNGASEGAEAGPPKKKKKISLDIPGAVYPGR